MCYDVATLEKKRIDYAKRRGEDPAIIRELEKKFQENFPDYQPYYHASGFSHPDLPCFLDEDPFNPQPLFWGLIPHWSKDKKISNNTLNARSETMFEKPAFRDSAKARRCLVYIDHFYEHHHFKGNTYPYLIKLKDNQPIILAGIWSEWIDPNTNKSLRSVSIVTTKANELMAEIHNNPKLEEPRMPVILPAELQDEWLKPVEEKIDIERLQELTVPYDASEMEAYTVGKLRGKAAVGNKPEVIEKVLYPELSQEKLF